MCFFNNFIVAGKDVKIFEIASTESKIKIDGILSEGEWDNASVFTLDYEIDPGDNIIPPVKTKVFVVYDKENLYVAFIAFDDKPFEIRANYCERDSAFRDDFVGFVIDPFNDERRGYEFFVNPFGVQMDLKRTEGGGEDASWDTIWNSAGKINKNGYSVEMAIPFKSISFPVSKDIQTWGFWAFRSYPRKFRYQISSMPFDRNVNCFFCQIPKITGFKNIIPGRNLEINPSFVAIKSFGKDTYLEPLTDNGTETQAGVNIRWAPTSNVIINATVNPDFSQVEADAVQLSINRNFSLFYREKRPFFLEESDMFVSPSRVVHTRTIADPSLGLKFTGKVNSYTYGAFYAEDTVTNYLVPSSTGSYLQTWEHKSNAIVFRGKKDIFSNSNIGTIVTSRSGGGYHNNVVGIDGSLYLSKNDSVTFQFLTSDTKNPFEEGSEVFKGEKLNGNMYLVEYSHESRHWDWDLGFERRDRDFRADLGFIGKVDTENFSGSLHYTVYGKEGAFISKFTPGVFVSFEKDTSGNVIGRVGHIQANMKMAGQSYAGIFLNNEMEYYDFKNHYFSNFGFWAGTRPSAYYAMHCGGNFGEAIDYTNNVLGRKKRGYFEFIYKPDEHIDLSLSIINEKFIELSTYLYKANVLQGNFIYNFSTRFFVRSIVQYTSIDRNLRLYGSGDENSKSLYSQLLLNYKINPRTLCYLGFSAGRLSNELYPMQTFNKAIFFKIAYAFRM
jgi:hypothetical protein